MHHILTISSERITVTDVINRVDRLGKDLQEKHPFAARERERERERRL